MKSTLAIIFQMTAVTLFASPAATTNWVANYVQNAIQGISTSAVSSTTQWVSNYVQNAILDLNVNSAHTNIDGVAMTIIRSGRTWMTIEDPCIHSLVATNVMSAAQPYGITNGMYFVWNEPSSSFTNHTIFIESTPSNLVWNSIQSDNDVFSNYFGVVRRLIQPSKAMEVTK